MNTSAALPPVVLLKRLLPLPLQPRLHWLLLLLQASSVSKFLLSHTPNQWGKSLWVAGTQTLQALLLLLL